MHGMCSKSRCHQPPWLSATTSSALVSQSVTFAMLTSSQPAYMSPLQQKQLLRLSLLSERHLSNNKKKEHRSAQTSCLGLVSRRRHVWSERRRGNARRWAE